MRSSQPCVSKSSKIQLQRCVPLNKNNTQYSSDIKNVCSARHAVGENEILATNWGEIFVSHQKAPVRRINTFSKQPANNRANKNGQKISIHFNKDDVDGK